VTWLRKHNQSGTQRPQFGRIGNLDTVHRRSQLRMLAGSALVHKDATGPLSTGLGNRDCHRAKPRADPACGERVDIAQRGSATFR
jgi:hypothetical protein